MELHGHIKSDDWGKLGKCSLAGNLYWTKRKRNLIVKETPYAELWIGTHPAGPCYIIKTGQELRRFLKTYPQLLGKCRHEYGDRLPFLMKILSVQKCCSLHCHPDKSQAKQLHEKFPNRYDKYAKSEMIIAISYMEILCGFRAKEEIAYFMANVPELAVVIPKERMESFVISRKDNDLTELFFNLLTAEDLEAEVAINAYFNRMKYADGTTKVRQCFTLIQKLQEQQPNDAGVFSPFFLNHIIMLPGDAMHLRPKIPHAYITECVECSSSSDNVVRGLLTSNQYKEWQTMMSILDFHKYTERELKMVPEDLNIFVRRYSPPTTEFAVDRISMPKGHTITLLVCESCSLFIIIKGSIRTSDLDIHERGSIIFLLPKQVFTFSSWSDMTLYHAYPNDNFVPKFQDSLFKD